MKWVVGFPENVAAGLPAIHGLTVLSDGRTGQPRAIVDAGALTAQRTAAISGLAIRHWGPPAGSAPRVAIVGAGAQARSHLPVVAHLLPDAQVVLHDQDRARAAALARDLERGAEGEPGRGAVGSAAGLGQVGAVRVADDPVEALRGADVVLTMVSFGPRHQAMPAEAFGSAGLVVAVDYDMCVPASLARSADLFLVDHREQYLANITETTFAGYPEDPQTIGEAIRGAVARPAGRVVVAHLGVGLADLVFADAVLRSAETRGVGTILSR